MKRSQENRDAMLQTCKQANEMFMQHGVLRYDVSQLNNTDVPMEGFSNIASTISAKQNEDVWIDSLYYKDRQYMSEVKARMEKDERMEPLMKQSIDLMPSGAKMIIGEFDRLSL
ncbi:MAG: DUF1428 family protein, partial [Nitrososphaeraceae archaeon]